MEIHVRVVFEETGDFVRFMGREVIEDDMDFLPGSAQPHDAVEEIHKLVAGVTGRCFAVYLATVHVERGVQRQRSVAIVFEAVTLGSTRRHRQNRVEPVKRLNGRFLIYTEHGRMLRRMQIQANDVGRLAFQLRIIAGPVTLQSMRLQTGPLPEALHAVFADAELRG